MRSADRGPCGRAPSRTDDPPDPQRLDTQSLGRPADAQLRAPAPHRLPERNLRRRWRGGAPGVSTVGPARRDIRLDLLEGQLPHVLLPTDHHPIRLVLKPSHPQDLGIELSQASGSRTRSSRGGQSWLHHAQSATSRSLLSRSWRCRTAAEWQPASADRCDNTAYGSAYARESAALSLAVGSEDDSRDSAVVTDGEAVLACPRPHSLVARRRNPATGLRARSGAAPTGTSPARGLALGSTTAIGTRRSSRRNRHGGVVRRCNHQSHVVHGPDDPDNVLKRLGGVDADSQCTSSGFTTNGKTDSSVQHSA